MSITKISPSVVDFDAGITISTTDNSTNLTLSSTDADANGGPILDFYRNSSSPADNDVLFQSNIYAENDADEKVAYGYINTFATDVSDGSESMKLNLNMYSGGSALNRLELSSSETVFNQDSGDIDFRVESDGNAKALVILGDKYGLGVGRDPESAYNGYSSIEFGQQGAIFGNDAGDDIEITINTYLDSSGNWKRKETGVAANLNLDGDQIKFFTAGSASADSTITFAQKLRIDNDGIKFGSDTAAANALDDYEEGTWTPTIQSTGTAAFSGARYTKVGRMVTVHYYVHAIGNTSSSASWSNSLPFTASDNNVAATLGFMGVDISLGVLSSAYLGTTNTVHFYSNSSSTAYQVLEHSHFGSNTAFYVSFTYMAA